MVVQYWALSPEINAIRLTTGPGAAAMVPVIAAYQVAGITHMEQGAQQLTTAAATAAGSWWGHGSTAMMASAVPQSEWQIEAGGHAQKASALIGQAANAHAAAVAATIPYPVVVANRVREAALQAGNILGQFTPAIIQADLEYADYWATNAGAMTTYASAATGIASGLSVPLRPPVDAAAPTPDGAAGMAGMAPQMAQGAAEAATQGLGGPVQAGGQALTSLVPAVLSAFTSAAGGTGGQSAALTGADTATVGASQLAGPAGSELLSAGESMLGLGSALPGLQGIGAELASGGGVGGAGAMLGSMPGMLAPSSGGLLASSAPGSGLAASVSGVSGGFGSSTVTASLIKPAGATVGGGPLGVPPAWWGQAGAAEGVAARAGMPSVTGAAPMGAGMTPMPMGVGAHGRHRDQSTGYAGHDGGYSVVLPASDAIPIVTNDGVVYTDGGGG